MSRRGLVLFGAMCVIWGIPYLLIRVAVRDLSPSALVLARTAIAALLLLPIALARAELWPAFSRLRPLLAFAAIEIGIPWILLNDAEQEISSSLTALLIAAVPLIGVVIAAASASAVRASSASPSASSASPRSSASTWRARARFRSRRSGWCLSATQSGP